MTSDVQHRTLLKFFSSLPRMGQFVPCKCNRENRNCGRDGVRESGGTDVVDRGAILQKQEFGLLLSGNQLGLQLLERMLRVGNNIEQQKIFF